MNLKKAVIIICAVWILIPAAWVIKNEIILHTGREVLLKTIPVDPRDLFMGDYVILNYEISALPENYKFIPNQNVYVLLEADENNIAKIKSVSNTKPENELFISGKISRAKCRNITGRCIKYGIESYYVKENTGRKLERELRNGALVKVSIDKDGSAKIKSINN